MQFLIGAILALRVSMEQVLPHDKAEVEPQFNPLGELYSELLIA